MSELSLGDASGFAHDCALIGDGQPADRIWTKDQYLALCDLMLNGNSSRDFMLTHRDKDGAPKFAKAKTQVMQRRASWAWDTIAGRAKSSVGLGFYPANRERKSRWAAMDFDAHDGDGARARRWALGAFDVLRRKTNLSLILATSGSAGWHLFVFDEEFHDIAEWTLLLKEVASRIDADLRNGCCELFPAEMRGAGFPRGIRAPGTWNPKTNQLGLIVFASINHLLAHHEKTKPAVTLSFAGSGKRISSARLYMGNSPTWLEQFAITQPGTRHAQLCALVYTAFRQVGRAVCRHHAEELHSAAKSPPKASLQEHLAEFEDLWTWIEKKWSTEFLEAERECLDRLQGEIQRDLFRIVQNFARDAAKHGRPDFPFSLENVGARLGVSFQYVSKLRQQFVDEQVIGLTAKAVPNVLAARFEWLLTAPQGKPIVWSTNSIEFSPQEV